MKWNFSEKIRTIDPAYRKRLDETITGYQHGTYQNVRLLNQQGSPATVDTNLVRVVCTPNTTSQP